MRIVIDSNVWVSALVFGGNPRKVFEKTVQNGYTLVISQEILSETRRILHSKFPDFIDDFEVLVVALDSRIEYLKLGIYRVDASRDKDDNKVIETALVGNAQFIVSGDKDLLVLEEYEKIKIVTPKNWLDPNI